MLQKKQSSIKLEAKDYKSIESIIRGFSEKYKISNVEHVRIDLSKDSGLVFFKRSDDTFVGEADPSELLREGLADCARGALMLSEYLDTTEDPEIKQLFDTIGYVIKNRKEIV